MSIFNKIKYKRLVKLLQNKIDKTTDLENIIDVFQEMSNIPIKDDMILFETGTYTFTEKPMFYFSLVRQFPNSEEEYYQIHVDVLYEPTEENSKFQRTLWNEDIAESIFDYIKESPEFNYCKNIKYSNIEIFLDET